MGYFEKVYQSDLSHRARAVYMYLKDHADKEGKCWPGIRTISAELRLSRSTVKRALDDLCEAELIYNKARERKPQFKFISAPVIRKNMTHRQGASAPWRWTEPRFIVSPQESPTLRVFQCRERTLKSELPVSTSM